MAADAEQPGPAPVAAYRAKVNAGGRWYFSEQTFDEIAQALKDRAPWLPVVDARGRRAMLNTQAVIAVEDTTPKTGAPS